LIWKDRSRLTTERRNPASADIDRRSTLEVMDIINRQDAGVPKAVHRQRRAMTAAVDLVAESLRRGGRLFYVGAGTSGRLMVVMDDGTETELQPGDAAVIPPGHDAWVVGDEPFVAVDFTGMREYARPSQAPPAEAESDWDSDPDYY
jgi:hypothetical protein